MKVKLENEYKSRYTLEDLEIAKQVIAAEKEDEMNIKEWAEYAVNEARRGSFDFCEEVLKAEARTAKNCRAWNLYGEGTNDMDVWIEATAKTSNGFVEVGAYLSDIWQTGATPYKQHMFIQYYGKQ